MITQKMIDAYEQLMIDYTDAKLCSSMGGMGGCKTLKEWYDKDVKNRDLIVACLKDIICEAEMVYTAMERSQS